MSKEKEKLLLSAQKLAQRGQNDKAIKEYQRALELDKKDVKTLLKLGDLQAKVKKNEDAIKAYADAAKLYARDGFYSKAIAVYKRVLELDANRDDIYLLMADLYQRLGMVGDAMTQYQRISSNYEKDGKLKEALEIYRNMAELDPRNVLTLTKLAELYYKNNNKPEGYTVFKRALDELKEQNRFEEYTRLMEKLAKADPDNVENLKELTTVYIKRKVYDRAYPFMVKIVQIAPDDLQSLGNLGELCVKLERKDEAIIQFKELAKAYQKKGLRQKAQEALSRVSFLEGKGGAAVPAAAPEPEPEAPGLEEVVELAEEFAEAKGVVAESGIEELNEAVEEEAVIETPEAGPEPEPSTLTPEQIQENITEADVYFKYGLRDKAMGHIQLVLKTDPKNIEALKRLKNIMMDAHNQDAALDTLRKIALYSDKNGDFKSLVEAAAEILRMVPNDAPAQAWLKRADSELSKQPAATAPKPEVKAEAKTEEPEVIEEEEVVVEEEEVPVEEAAPEPAPKAVEKPAPEPLKAKAPPAPAPKTPPPPPPAEVKPAPPPKAPAAPLPAPAPAAKAPPPPSPVAAKAPPRIEEEIVMTGKAEAADKDIKEEIEEAEFYVQQGLLEEALRVYLEILKKAPGNKNAVRRAKELENNIAAKTPKAAAEPAKKAAPIEIQVEEAEPEAPVAPPPAPVAEVKPAAKAAPITIEEEEEVTAGEVIEEEEEAAPAPEAARPEPAPAPAVAEARPEMAIEEEEELVTEEAMVGFEGPPAPESAEAPPEPAPQQEPAPTPVETPAPAPVQEAAPAPQPAPEPTPATIAVEPAPAPEPEHAEKPVAEEAPASYAPAVSAPEPAPTEQIPEEPAFAVAEEAPAISEPPAAATAVSEPPAPAQAPAEAAGGDMFDLAAELEKEDLGAASPEISTLSTSEKYSFDTMFKSFKEGVSKVVSETDSSTHYDLGIAYKEMGLCDDAVREFQTALKAGHNAADCYVMIGLCHCERGKFEDAIKEYDQAVANPSIPEKDKAAIFYELGQSWLSLGNLESSKSSFEKCQAIDPALREVGAKIEELNTRLAGKKPEIPPTPSREDKSWESAALEQKPSDKPVEEEDAAKKKSRKKISYV